MSKADRYTTLTAAGVEALDGIIKGTAIKFDTPIQRAPGLFEMVRSGAFNAQLKAPNRVSVLWQHDWDSPIGRATDLQVVGKDLRFEAKVSTNPAVPDATRALALLDEGILDEISVGFGWGTWTEERNADTGDITIVHTKAALKEFSVVTFGAMGQDATVKSVADERSGLSIQAYRARLARLTS